MSSEPFYQISQQSRRHEIMIILVTFGQVSIAQSLTKLGSRPLGRCPVAGVPHAGSGFTPGKVAQRRCCAQQRPVRAVAPCVWPRAVPSPGCLVVKASEVNSNMTQVLDSPLPNPVKKFACQTPRPFVHIFFLLCSFSDLQLPPPRPSPSASSLPSPDKGATPPSQEGGQMGN